jgi:hypothetical protein
MKYSYCISGFGAAVLMQQLRNYLILEYVPIMETTFRSGARESCVAQRSIYVMLTGKEETRSYINQVGNVQRRLFSAAVQVYIRTQVTLHEMGLCF